MDTFKLAWILHDMRSVSSEVSAHLIWGWADEIAAAARNDYDLRDYFAAKAMQATVEGCSHGTASAIRALTAHVAKHAYVVADAMLKARGETP